MRSYYWDNWKGLAIVAVVMIHATNSTSSFPPSTFDSDVGVVLRQFINFPVGLFIFLSAYFAENSKKAASRYVDRTRARVWRLALPYLVWAMIYSAARLVFGSLIIEDLPLMLINGTVVSVGYYVIVMIQMAILSPALESLSDRFLGFLIPLSSAFSLAFFYSSIFFDVGKWGEFPYSGLPFFVWLPFYLGGLLASRKKSSLKQIPKGIFTTCIAAGVSLSLVEAFLVLVDFRSLAMSQLKLTSMITTGVICVMAVSCFKPNQQHGTYFLSWVGRRSFYFYLSHMMVLGKVQRALQEISVLFDSQILFIAVSSMVTILICASGAWTLEAILQRREAGQRAFGLA